ncbi:MAG TPA: DUF4105 domain-containing protein [Caulobacteraceae bacterium]|jgi:hypothetical protein
MIRALVKRAAAGVAVVAAASGLLAGGYAFSQTPRLDRAWVEHLAVLPRVDVDQRGFAVAPATDWSYDAAGPVRKESVAFSAAFADLRNVWFVLEPQPGGGYAAHTLVLFEFADDRVIGLTVEARREADEAYDPLLGLFNRYELAYVWSTARELLNRRAVYLAKEVYVYPLALSPQQRLDFLKAALEETRSVSEKPRFYNTFTSNCTNELARTAGLGWHYSWVLTGYSPQRLFDLGLIPGESLEDAKARARLTAQLRRWNAMPKAQFDRTLLRELRARHGLRGATDA